MDLDAKAIFYITVGASWGIGIIFVRKIKKIAAHFWSVLPTFVGRIRAKKIPHTQLFKKIGQKMVKWPLSAHF